MTTLTFTQEGDYYVSKFTISTDTALHLEKNGSAPILLLQNCGNSGEYDIVKEWNGDNFEFVIDTELKANVYPKYMKLMCKNQPTLAYTVEG